MHKVICAATALLILWSTSRASKLSAEVIAQFGVAEIGSGFAAGIGQSVTTPVGGPWENITFNFYDSGTGDSQAEGNLYIFSSAYTGTPQAMNSSTPNLLGVAPATGSVYTFDTSLTLSPATQYFFYCDTRPNGPGGTTILGDDYSGGTFLKSPNGTGSFVNTSFADVAFNLEGTAMPSPEPSTTLLGLLAFGSLTLMGLQRRRRKVAPATVS